MRKGFSLLELILAMAIIAIISGALWGNFFSSITKGRDAKRKQDLESTAKALELYYNDFRAYPTSVLPSWGQPFVNASNSTVIYMQKLPVDPSDPNSTYCYASDTNGSYYKIYGNLENRNDAKVFTTPVPCNGVNYNYGISSSNVTP